MRTTLALFSVIALLLAPSARAAHNPDPVLVEGLRAGLTNGLPAILQTWFADQPALAQEMREKLSVSTKLLGEIIDTEIVAIQPVSKRVTRYYVAIYFTRGPLWLRVERYASADQASYLPLRFSTNADDILPGYVTEFRQ